MNFDWNEMETWVRLVNTHLMVCNLTYFGQSVTLTLGDLKSKLPNDLSGLQSVCVDPLDERKTMTAKSALYLK